MPVEIGPGGGAGLWLLEMLENPPQSDECLKWPFACDLRGYGQVSFDGKVQRASRVVCTLVNGPPPTPKHHAAHNCGKGSSGCIHPRHVEWKTGSENQLDRRKHGTHTTTGSRKKLTPDQVREIRAIGRTMTQRAVAAKFGISDASVRDILARRYWNSV